MIVIVSNLTFILLFFFTLQDLYLLQVCFLAHLVQLLLTYEKQNPVSEMEVEDDEEGGEEAPKDSAGESGAATGDAEWLVSMLDHCRRMASLPPIAVQPQRLLAYIKENWYGDYYCCPLG